MILIALGANLPHNGQPPAENIRLAMNVLDRLFGVSKRSSLYESPAWPDPTDPPYVNAVVLAQTTAHPSTILKALHSTEAAFGRQRTVKNAPRTMDLDLLAVDDLVINATVKNGVAVPHPSLHKRDFVLVPLVEILPEWVHPESQKTAQQLLNELTEINTFHYHDRKDQVHED